MTRITLRLPDTLHDRLVQQSHQIGKSLNQVIVDALQIELQGGSPPTSQRALLRQALEDLIAPPKDTILLAPDDDQTSILSHEELQRRVTGLSPTLSETVIEGREERF